MYFDFLWTDDVIEHIGQNGVTQDDFEHVMSREARRSEHQLTSEERKRVETLHEQIANELPDMNHRIQLRKAAAEEHTLSGEIRRAIHESDLSLSAIAQRCGLTPSKLDEFLTAEQTLPSDVLDRLSEVLGCSLVRAD